MEQVIEDKLKSVLKDFEAGEYPLEINGKKILIKVYCDSEEDMTDIEFSKISTTLAFKDEEDEVADEFKHLLKKIEA